MLPTLFGIYLMLFAYANFRQEISMKYESVVKEKNTIATTHNQLYSPSEKGLSKHFENTVVQLAHSHIV